MWFVLGLLLAWAALKTLTPSPVSTPPGDISVQAPAAAAVESALDHVNDAVWRQSLMNQDPVPLVLDNQSGMHVLVKVVNLDLENAQKTVDVPDGSRIVVECPVGRSCLKMRYKGPEGYYYQKGNDFSLSRGSRTEITLHKVRMGNYGSSPIASSDF